LKKDVKGVNRSRRPSVVGEDKGPTTDDREPETDGRRRVFPVHDSRLTAFYICVKTARAVFATIGGTPRSRDAPPTFVSNRGFLIKFCRPTRTHLRGESR